MSWRAPRARYACCFSRAAGPELISTPGLVVFREFAAPRAQRPHQRECRYAGTHPEDEVTQDQRSDRERDSEDNVEPHLEPGAGDPLPPDRWCLARFAHAGTVAC